MHRARNHDAGALPCARAGHRVGRRGGQRASALLLALLALLLGACAGSGRQAGTIDALADARAASLCASIHDAAAGARGACLGRAPPATLTAACRTLLAPALARGALRWHDERIADCRRDVAASLVDCAAIARRPPATPASCLAVLQGQGEAGARCASALECRDGLHCLGAGAAGGGRCAAPAAPGAACTASSDPLTALLGGREDARHASCVGTCVRGRCVAAAAADAPVGSPRAPR